MGMLNKSYKTLMIFVALIVVALLAYSALTMRDQRSPTERLGDAIHELPQGVDKAERQLEDRTPGEKLGDAVKDAGEKIKENAQPSNSQ
jgi:HAMP domain-containing protein